MSENDVSEGTLKKISEAMVTIVNFITDYTNERFPIGKEIPEDERFDNLQCRLSVLSSISEHYDDQYKTVSALAAHGLGFVNIGRVEFTVDRQTGESKKR